MLDISKRLFHTSNHAVSKFWKNPVRLGWRFWRIYSAEQPHAFLTFHIVHSAVWSTFGAVMVWSVTVLQQQLQGWEGFSTGIAVWITGSEISKRRSTSLVHRTINHSFAWPQYPYSKLQSSRPWRATVVFASSASEFFYLDWVHILASDELGLHTYAARVFGGVFVGWTGPRLTAFLTPDKPHELPTHGRLGSRFFFRELMIFLVLQFVVKRF